MIKDIKADEAEPESLEESIFKTLKQPEETGHPARRRRKKAIIIH